MMDLNYMREDLRSCQTASGMKAQLDTLEYILYPSPFDLEFDTLMEIIEPFSEGKPKRR